MSTTTVLDAPGVGRSNDRQPSGRQQTITAPGATTDAATRPPVGWLPWSDPNHPATSADERRFVEDLRSAAHGRRRTHRRSDLTALLNALRGGLTVDELVQRAPGLDLQRLYDAYVALDDMRKEAVEAWRAIESSRSLGTVRTEGAAAARLLPVIVARLEQLAEHEPSLVPVAIDEAARDIETAHRLAQRLEHELDRAVDRSDWAMKIGKQLYDPRGESVFGRNDYLPTRVGSLVPQRVAKLLEPRDESSPDRMEW